MRRAFPSLTECDEWVGREDRALLETRLPTSACPSIAALLPCGSAKGTRLAMSTYGWPADRCSVRCSEVLQVAQSCFGQALIKTGTVQQRRGFFAPSAASSRSMGLGCSSKEAGFDGPTDQPKRLKDPMSCYIVTDQHLSAIIRWVAPTTSKQAGRRTLAATCTSRARSRRQSACSTPPTSAALRPLHGGHAARWRHLQPIRPGAAPRRSPPGSAMHWPTSATSGRASRQRCTSP